MPFPSRPTSDHSFKFSSAANVGEAISSLCSLLKPPPLRLPLSSLVLPYGQDPNRRMDRKVDSPIEGRRSRRGGVNGTICQAAAAALNHPRDEGQYRRVAKRWGSDRPAGNEGLALLTRGIGPLFLFVDRFFDLPALSCSSVCLLRAATFRGEVSRLTWRPLLRD